MPAAVRALISVGLLGAVAWLTVETWRLAEQLGLQEVATREARGEAEREAAARHGAETEIARLNGELARNSGQLSAMAERVTAATETALARAAAAREADLLALAPMPEGVRQCLDALHQSLAVEGFSSLRFLRAASLDAVGLHDVEVVYTHSDGLAAEVLLAQTMTAVLDRGAGRLVLTFLDGTRSRAGDRTELPAKGWPIVVAPVRGHVFERRLPYLVRTEGVYPADQRDLPQRLPTDVDAATRYDWLERFDRLLSEAGTNDQITVRGFRGIAGGAFLEADVLGTDAKDHVRFGAGCARLAVEVDRKAGIVSLLLQDGTLRRGEATSNISGEGMRILLPDVTPAEAVETMLGMVVQR